MPTLRYGSQMQAFALTKRTPLKKKRDKNKMQTVLLTCSAVRCLSFLRISLRSTEILTVTKNSFLVNILENAKTSRPSVCNAAEVCLVDENIADKILPLIKKRLVDKRIADGKIPVELRLDSQAAKIIDGTAAGENDFDTEFLDYVIAIKTVSGVKEACEHIAAHSTGHSEAIISENPETTEYFTRVIDSAAVYVNASTRFTDGGEFGLGCEIGISTQKLHARGPMGLCELNTYKYIIRGSGQVR